MSEILSFRQSQPRVPSAVRRRELTDVVLKVLARTGKPVGDAVSPEDGGWIGQPNEDGSNFIPYVVLFPGASTVSSGPLCDTQADWQCVYSLSNFGVNRTQCEWMADLSREMFVRMERDTIVLGSDQYRVLQARETVLGPIQRMDATQPAFFGQVDAVTLWISKELSR
jgi:hypothetical protein